MRIFDLSYLRLSLVIYGWKGGNYVSYGHYSLSCGERTNMMAELGEKFAEAPVAMGLTSAGAVIEVLTSTTGSWTFLVTYPWGQTCMVASGKSWETLPIKKAGQIS